MILAHVLEEQLLAGWFELGPSHSSGSSVVDFPRWSKAAGFTAQTQFLLFIALSSGSYRHVVPYDVSYMRISIFPNSQSLTLFNAISQPSPTATSTPTPKEHSHQNHNLPNYTLPTNTTCQFIPCLPIHTPLIPPEHCPWPYFHIHTQTPACPGSPHMIPTHTARHSR